MIITVAIRYLKIKIIAITWLSKTFLVISLLFVREMLYLNAIAQMNGATKISVMAAAVTFPQIPLMFFTTNGPMAEYDIKASAIIMQP